MSISRLDERNHRETATEAAEAYGIDISLLDDNLLKTPEERLHQHCLALQLAHELRRAAEERRARP